MKLKPYMLVLLTVSLFACKKERIPKDQFPTQLTGTWKGQYGFYQSPAPGDTMFHQPDHFYTVIFEKDSTMTVYDGNEDAALKGVGRYGIRSRELTAEYHYIRGGSGSFSLRATLTEPGKLDGKWLIGLYEHTGGKFYLTRQF
ncbi:hypothetical protein [Chitinophaga barathri]|uniref:Lipocalin-like domain-containing protein n=1 Tax=Chitinophaga barathri TaxID=1647451 RepID=A0A3N4MIS2_9BACT|nr:hypothetical protein [Chitinophaga barathri]RPD41936.1 hypothetical protein EG028_07195 [Chitinophaga barathri]